MGKRRKRVAVKGTREPWQGRRASVEERGSRRWVTGGLTQSRLEKMKWIQD